MAPPEAAQEGPQSLPSRKRGVEGALTVPPRVRAAPRCATIVVVNAVAPSQRRGHQRHQLVARVRPPRGIAQVQAPVNQLGQTQVQDQRGRKDQPGIGD